MRNLTLPGLLERWGPGRRLAQSGTDQSTFSAFARKYFVWGHALSVAPHHTTLIS